MHNIFSTRTKELLEVKDRILVGYLLAGYKTSEDFFEYMKICEEGGIDIFEIGFPSKNPYADGEVIAKAHYAVDHDEATSIDYWKKIRESTDKPIWLMAYYSDFIGTNAYKVFVKNKLIDGIVIPDANFETRKALQEELSTKGVDVIGFANPKMSKAELVSVLDGFSMVYEQLYIGQTGSMQPKEEYHEMLAETIRQNKGYAFAGFGINTFDKVKKILDEGFDGAIIGTEIMKKLNSSKEMLRDFLSEIQKAV